MDKYRIGGEDKSVKRGVKASRKIVAAFALVLALTGGGYATEKPPVVPDSRPDKDEIVVVCDEGAYGVYAHMWREQRVFVFGSVYRNGKHDPPDAIVTWDEKDEANTVWYHGVKVPDAKKWLEDTDLCDMRGATEKS